MLHSPIAESKQPSLAARATAAYEAHGGTMLGTTGNQSLLRMKTAPVVQSFSPPGERKVHRKCAACEEKEETKLHRKESGSGPALAPASVHDVLRTPGHPLDPVSRTFFERRFGGDLGRVRIHDTAEAGASAQAVGALGYTVGQHIAFARGQYQPGTDSGRRLLAHELAHTMQDHGANPGNRPLSVSPASGPDELAADRMSSAALAIPNQRVQRPAPSGPALRRQTVGDFKLDPCVTVPVIGEACGQKAADVCKKVSLPGCGAVCKLFDCHKTEEPKNTCPPGFLPGRSKEHKGECCKEKAASESDQDCCSADRANMFGACCPVGQVAQGMGCVTPSTEPLPIPDLCPPERKTPFGKCCVPPQIPGVIDCMDPLPVNPPPGQPASTPAIVASPVYFNLDRPHAGDGKSALNSCVTGEGAANLKALIAQLKANPGLKVQLVGRASPEGDFKYNLDLGARRARMVADALASGGIGAAQIDDAPGGGAGDGCQAIGTGMSTCGEIGSSGERDRQVFPTVFTTAPPPPATP